MNKDIELKFIDNKATLKPWMSTRSANGCLLLNGAAQGAGTSQRVGIIANVRSISLRLRLRGGNSTSQNNSYIYTAVPCTVRVMLIVDYQGNGANLDSNNGIITTVLQDTLEPVESPLRTYFGARFKVLMDKQYCLGGVIRSQYFDGTNYLPGVPTTLLTAPPLQICDTIYRKVNIKTRYANTGSTASDIIEGAIYLLVMTEARNITDNGNGDGALPDCHLYTRVRYTDV